MKKLNIAILTILLVFQTILGPIGSYNTAFANENDSANSLDASNDNSEQQEAPSGLENSLMDASTPTPDSATISISEEITNVTLTQFDMKIGGNTVTEGVYSTSLPQNQTAQFDVTFEVMLDKLYGAGSYFEFQLPNSLIDFDSAFEGQKSVDGVTYKYETIDNKVRVELVNELTPDDVSTTTAAKMTMTFNAGFNLTSKELEQNLVLPKTNSGSDTVTTKFTFLPSTSNEKASKQGASGIPASVEGNHQLEWTVWINRAGNDFINPSLIDNPTGGHAILADSVNVYEYVVDLDGVETSSRKQVVIDGNLGEINFQNKHAYEIVYKTEVNLDVAQREGNKTFTNTITFTNNGVEESDTASKQITYGKAIEKVKDISNGKINSNYESNWEIRFNYNEARISADSAVVKDAISSNNNTHKHLIDTTTIKVYKVEIENGAKKPGTTDQLLDPAEYTISGILGSAKEASSFELKFNNDITEAYRIVYQANYVEQDFYDGNSNTIITNIATYDSKSVSASHTLTNALLTKSQTVDFATKQITWTINIKNDHHTKPITGLTLNDQFEMTGKTGEHTLIGGEAGIAITNAGTPTKTVDSDNKGFEITNITIAPNTTVEVKYKTSFAISDEGTVVVNGYGNTATTTWTSAEKEYTQTRTQHYTPGTTTVNNGTKSGKIDYTNQKFTWEVRVNINKKDIQSAVLTDEIKAGHEFVEGSLKVYKLTLGINDDVGTYSTADELSASNYDLSIDLDKKGYSLTFKNSLDATLNNEAYVVVYETKDSDNIFGIGSNEDGYTAGNVYGNEAKFQTRGTQNFTLNSTPVTIPTDIANSLIKKGAPIQNSSAQKVTWMLDVNKSHSNLGETVVEDTPSQNLMLVPNSIKLRAYAVSATAISAGSTWQTPEQLKTTGVLKEDIEFTPEGGFKLIFGNLTTGYQVQYETIGLGKSGDGFTNEARINFAGETATNQEISNSVTQKFSFSSSDSSFSMTKGSAKFKKIGVDSVTGVSEELENVQFQLIKKIGSTEYIIRTATSDAKGEFEFNNINYGNYTIKEVEAPSGYQLMPSKAFTLSADNDAKLVSNSVATLVNTTVLPADACTTFDLTIYDVDGKPFANQSISLYDFNGELKYTGNTDGNGKLEIPTTVLAGEYTVKDSNEKTLGTTTVKFGQDDCHAEIKPSPSCPVFTVTLTEKEADSNDKPRVGVTVTLKDSLGNQVTTATPLTTDENGQFTVPSTTPAGKYTVYEGSQYLGEITVSYIDNCETSLSQAPKCPNFTLTVKDADGKPVSGKTVIVKSEDGSKTIPVTGPTDSAGNVTLNDLEPGKYIVYDSDGITKIGEFTTTTDCKAEVQPNPSCPLFVLIVKDEDGNLSEGTVVILTNSTDSAKAFEATVGENGKVQLPNTTSSEKYKVTIKEINKELGEFTLSYTSNCEATVELPKSCSIFTITVKNPDGTPKQNAEVIVEDSSGNAVALTASTTDAEGEIQLPNDQAPGVYSVFEVNSNGEKADKIGDVKVTYTSDCKADVIKNACTKYTLTINNSDAQPVGADVKIVMKKADGTVVASSVTNAAGQIEYSKVEGTLQQGEIYKVFNGAGVELGIITVSYINDICGAVVEVPTNSCPIFTLTVQDLYGIKRPNITVMIKDANENTIATGTTDADGKVTVPYTVVPGTYKVYEGTTLLGTITTITCEAVFKPVYPVIPPSGGGGDTPPPTNPGEPEKPGTPPTNPGEPEKPGTPPTNPGEPEKPGTPPINPGEPEKPGTSPTNTGEQENVSTPPTNIGKPTEQVKTKIVSTAKLPQTNGNFSTATTLFGLVLLAAAALLIVRRKKLLK
ncbi:MAG: collagen binding domain-containing protein [Psychrobacillus psychrodurans]